MGGGWGGCPAAAHLLYKKVKSQNQFKAVSKQTVDLPNLAEVGVTGWAEPRTKRRPSAERLAPQGTTAWSPRTGAEQVTERRRGREGEREVERGRER